MKSKFTATLAFAICLATSGAVAQGDDRSLPNTDSEHETAESSAVLAIEKLVVENRRLKAELDDARKTAAANTAEAEVFKRQVKDLTLRYLPDASHFVQQDAYGEVNAMLEAWLTGRPVPGEVR